MAANLKRQLELATQANDIALLRTLLSAAENIGLDPFDYSVTQARLKYTSALYKQAATKDNTEAKLASAAAAVSPANQPQPLLLSTSKAEPGNKSKFRGSRVIGEFEAPSRNAPSLSDPPESSRLLGSFLLRDQGTHHKETPSARAAAAFAMASKAPPPVPNFGVWGSATHPWSHDRDASVSVSTASDASVVEEQQPAGPSTMLGSVNSPRSTTSTVMFPSNDASLRGSMVYHSEAATRARNVAMALQRNLLLDASLSQRLTLQEEAQRRSIYATHRAELASLVEGHMEMLAEWHRVTAQKALATIGIEEAEARRAIFQRYAKLASQLYRDFQLHGIHVQRITELRNKESEDRQVIELQESYYFHDVMTKRSKMLAASINDWRRTVNLVELEKQSRMLDLMATRGWGEDDVPLLQRRPQSRR